VRLVSVNVGEARPVANAKASGVSGIYKEPAAGRVWISPSGLAGDEVSDKENHGGPDQAVYVYGAPDYAWWAEALGRELAPGTFGENLTVSGLVSARFSVGDRLRVNDAVVLEVTAPRIPCVTLAVRMGDPAFVKRFRHAERPGLYCRVVEEGYVRAGDPVRVEPYRGETISAIEMFRDFFDPRQDEATIRRHLAAPIAIRDRVAREEQLAELMGRNPDG
jgi:MOSC domain-containing protein YiiM